MVYILGTYTTLEGQTTCVISTNTGQVKNANAKKLLGVTYDGRSSADFDAGAGVDPVGYHDPATGALLVSQWNRMPMTGVRYPANLVTYNWNWSYTVGPFQNRIAQPMGPGGNLSQKLQFGFDEFMSMVEAKGLSASDVQIMVNIYASVGQPDPATLAADWVEYCNTLYDNINPRGGTDWAAIRAATGRVQPYNVQIWNIGNEPWTGGEFGSSTAGADNYMAVASRIIDSMLAVDPTIKITIPAVGNGASSWNAEIMNANAPNPLLGKIYGLSPHAFYDTDAATPNPTPSQALTLISNVAATAASKGLKIIVGDHAHFAPNSDPDKAMRWEGALATADLLTGLCQISNIELANYWVYGNAKATWHPIRENANGSYTFMAAAQLYEAFYPYYHDESVTATIVNAVGGASVPNMRVAAFQQPANSQAAMIVVNTNTAVDNEIVAPSWNGLNLQAVKLLSAASLSQDTFTTTTVQPLPNGHYASPRSSILIFDFSASPLAVEYTNLMRAYPLNDEIVIEWGTASEDNCAFFEVEKSADVVHFQKIASVEGHGSDLNDHYYSVKDFSPLNGHNYYRIKQVDFDGKHNYSIIFSAFYKKNTIAIYPNPSHGIVHFISTDPIVKINVMDYSGRLVKAIDQIRDFIDIQELPPGLYTLYFLNKQNELFIKKVITY